MLRYAITDRRRLACEEHGRRRALLELAAAWAADCIDFIQLREKDLTPGALADLACSIRSALGAHAPHPSRRPKLLINSRADVAVAAGADGVHLTSSSGQLTPAQIRSLYSAAELPEPTVSISCHSLAEVSAARDSGANLILFGPVFEKVIGTSAAPEVLEQRAIEGSGVPLLAEASRVAGRIPVLALGGVTAENTGACLRAGAAGVAAIRLFTVDGAAAVD